MNSKYPLFLLFMVLLILVGCTRNTAQRPKTSTAENPAPVKKEAFEFPAFQASGSEPGWSLLSKKVGTRIFYEWKVQNGEVIFSGKANFRAVKGAEGKWILQLNAGKEMINCEIERTACQDLTGEPQEMSIRFYHNGSKYLGCGNFKDDLVIERVLLAPVDGELGHYICFTNDADKTKGLMMSFTKDGLAYLVKYKGQKAEIDLEFVSEEYRSIRGTAHPTSTRYYNERYEGKINGIYALTHSGNWDYVEYVRGSDAAKFQFTIDHDANPYGKIACF